MNILILNAGRGWGGIESHSVTLSSGLGKKGHKAIIACSEKGHVRGAATDMGLATVGLEVMNACDPLSIAKIIRIISRHDITALVANLGKEYWPATIAARLLGINVILVRHQTDRIRRTTRWLIANHVDRVVAVSEAVRSALLRSRIAADKITVIHNSVLLEKFDPGAVDVRRVREELGFSMSDLVAGTVGKIHRGKGVFELMRAASILRDKYPVKLLYVGEGPEMGALKKESQGLGMAETIVFAGLRRDIERMYAAMDVFVLPSYNEGMPTVLLEAMAMARPVIATPVGGIPEIINNGENGMLVPVSDHVAVAEVFETLFNNRSLMHEMGLKGRETVVKGFSETAMAGHFERILQGKVE